MGKGQGLSIHNNWFKNRLDNELKTGMVQVYTGNGKGKTTAALGQALRACGYNLKSVIIQFLKGGSHTGEFKIQGRLFPYFKIIQVGRPFFIDKNNVPQKDIELNRNGFNLALEIATSKNNDTNDIQNTHDINQVENADTNKDAHDINILVLDEINVAVNLGIIKIDEILNLIKNKRKDLELILTGRNAAKEIIEAADLVTEMKEIKHYYQKNIPSRFGIEK